MANAPITSMEDALLRVINAARASRLTLEAMIDDSGYRPEEESMEAVAEGKTDEELAMAYLQANAAKCPGCREAFAFQRQKKQPNRCSWCGYDHDTGISPGLVPA